jgi:acylphosphatase
MSDRTALRLRIRGRVQGVGYRYAMASEAEARGLTGWVRNRRDGSVEAMVAGEAGAVEALRAWATRGPPGSAVSSVDAEPGEGSFERFEIAPTA